jgi:hypothetical protein
MAQKKAAPIRYRATKSFDEALEPLFLDFCQIPQLKGKVVPERIRKELHFIWEVGGNYLRQPSRPERLQRCVATGENASEALQALLQNITKLVHNYSLQDFYTAYSAHPLYGQALDDVLSLPKLASDISDLRADIGIAVEIFSTMPGLRWSKSGELTFARKGTTDPLAQIVHIASKSWRLLTKKEIQFAKGVEMTGVAAGTGANGKKRRPLQDDVNFAHLCIRLVTGIDNPSTAITTVNRARKARATYAAAALNDSDSAKASQIRVEFLDRHDDEMRRTIYGLEY